MWSKRYRQINDFERMLSENGVHIVKFLLYISKDEQARRFRARIDDKTKNWKFSEADLRERQYWDQYSTPSTTRYANATPPCALVCDSG